MASSSLQQQIASMRQSLFDEGILDRQHFIQVEYLEDGGDPNFVKDYIGVYLSDSLKNLNAIEQALEAKSLDVVELEKCLELLKDDCLNIGDQKGR
ncbi:pseudo histidine-containing phosphotransfer protein 5-like [Quercus lobata]|uniref:pseudo histidine-containing phosphotransfer protein 5-like n=1 Tax=Quercus lobata TaxID=97700 RepID=UPI00124512C0|nr:pseudo histidine-containing phosphotransfer protein 5-like [Quercus lobata]